jgi:hypothetical protein
MKIDKMFESKWLKAADVDEMTDESGTAVVTIDRVEMAEVGDGNKPIMYLRGVKVPMVLNKTNANTLGTLLGKDTDDWIGKSVGLFTTEVDFQGSQVLSIRVRMKLPKTRRPVAETSDESAAIPF